MHIPPSTTIGELVDLHDSVLLDAYGVLVDAAGALPGATELIALLTKRNLPFAVVTNDASRSASTCATRFASLGLSIGAEKIVTAGSLIAAHFAANQLAGARCLVLGTTDSIDYVEHAGGEILPLQAGQTADAIVVCDDAGFPFLQGVELAFSTAIRTIERGNKLSLVLPNPDLVYPKQAGEFGFTAGAIAMLIEAGLARRFPELALQFARLGKPGRDLLIAGAKRCGGKTPVMIGDQLETDIAAAHAAGYASALVAGVSRLAARSTIQPTYLLGSLL